MDGSDYNTFHAINGTMYIGELHVCIKLYLVHYRELKPTGEEGFHLISNQKIDPSL